MLSPSHSLHINLPALATFPFSADIFHSAAAHFQILCPVLSDATWDASTTGWETKPRFVHEHIVELYKLRMFEQAVETNIKSFFPFYLTLKTLHKMHKGGTRKYFILHFITVNKILNLEFKVACTIDICILYCHIYLLLQYINLWKCCAYIWNWLGDFCRYLLYGAGCYNALQCWR